MKIRKGSLSYWVLLALEGVANTKVHEMFSYSAQMKDLLNLPHLSYPTKKSSLEETIRRLRKNGLIEQERSQEGATALRLTELGKDFLGVKEPWDGKYRIVIWDIPERKRRLRDLFRRKLKEWSFKNWQKSVWVSKRNVTDKLRNLIRELEMEEWIVVIESDDPSLSHINFHDRGR